MCQVLYESKKSLDVVIVMGLLPVPYLLHLIGVGMYASVRYDMAETIHSLQVQIDFVSTEVKLSFVQLVEHHG